MSKVLRPIHGDRRELAGDGRLSGAQTAARIRAFEQALERKSPGGSRWIRGYKPFTDRFGRFHLGVELRDRRAPLSVVEAVKITTDRLRAERDEGHGR